MLIRIDLNKVKRDSVKKMKQLRNALSICGYLIRHGAGGFIDEFRDNMELLKALTYQARYNDVQGEEVEDSRLKFYISQNAERSKYLI